ncbi:hypothetical protein DASC09_059640 [Saccharomycopsis crataegensis]|uniref:SEC7 domain-containing protein n=1 Tax=Saccharomycopsis crataegensis TaxID=43959 RepID=A0AAV5QVI8_9ASCO|nr:hypothetical protein DASC09_059640 [Saccharomycopsis crataegensis]
MSSIDEPAITQPHIKNVAMGTLGVSNSDDEQHFIKKTGIIERLKPKKKANTRSPSSKRQGSEATEENVNDGGTVDVKKNSVPNYISRKLNRKRKSSSTSNTSHKGLSSNSHLVSETSNGAEPPHHNKPPNSSPISSFDASPTITIRQHFTDQSSITQRNGHQKRESGPHSLLSYLRPSADHSRQSSFGSLVLVESPRSSLYNITQTSSNRKSSLDSSNNASRRNSASLKSPGYSKFSFPKFSKRNSVSSSVQDESLPVSEYSFEQSPIGYSSKQFNNLNPFSPEIEDFSWRHNGSNEGTDGEAKQAYAIEPQNSNTEPRIDTSNEGIKSVSKKFLGLTISSGTYHRNKKNSLTSSHRPKNISVDKSSADRDFSGGTKSFIQSPSIISPSTRSKKKTFSIFDDDDDDDDDDDAHIKNNGGMKEVPNHRDQYNFCQGSLESSFVSEKNVNILGFASEKYMNEKFKRNRFRSNSLNDSLQNSASNFYKNLPVNNRNATGTFIDFVQSSRTPSRSGSKTPSRRNSVVDMVRFSNSQASSSKPGSPLMGSTTPSKSDDPFSARLSRRRSQTLSSLMNSTYLLGNRSSEKFGEENNTERSTFGLKLRRNSRSFLGLNSGTEDSVSSGTVNHELNKPTSRINNNNKNPAGSDLKFSGHSYDESTSEDDYKGEKESFFKYYSASLSNKASNADNVANIPKPMQEDTYVSYLLKLMTNGFSYEITDILSSKIAINKYPIVDPNKSYEKFIIFQDKESCRELFSRTFGSSYKNSFYTNCLYLFIYLHFLSMFYDSNWIFPQADNDLRNPVYNILSKFNARHIGAGDNTDKTKKISSLSEQQDFLEFHIDKVTSIPIDLVFRHFLFYNKLPPETEKIDLTLEIISYNYYYFMNLTNLKFITGSYRIHDDDLNNNTDNEDFNDTVIITEAEKKDEDRELCSEKSIADISTLDTSKFTIFHSVNEIYTLLFVSLVLQTDHFNKNNRSKMSQQDFTNIINNFKKEDFNKAKKKKFGAKLSETPDSQLLFNLLTPELIGYFYENITFTPMKSILEIISPSVANNVYNRSGSVASTSSLGSPLSPSFASLPSSTTLGRRKNSSFFLSSSSLPNPSNDPYSIATSLDIKALNLDFEIYDSSNTDPFASNFKEFKEMSKFSDRCLLDKVLDTLNTKDPDCILRLDHSEDLTDLLFKISYATIKPSLTNILIKKSATIRKSLSAKWPHNQKTGSDMSIFVRIFNIGIVYKQESKLSLLPKISKKKNKRRSKNFNNVNLNDSDTFVWKKYFAILTTFGVYIFKNINWDVLQNFEEEVEEQEKWVNNDKIGESNSNGDADYDNLKKKLRHMKVYASAFFLQSNNSELELAIPINKVFSYHNKYKDFHSFYVCYSNNDNDSKVLKSDEVDITNDWMKNPKSNKVYNKGLFYCASENEANQWVFNINYLAAMHKCLPIHSYDKSFTNLVIPSYENIHELTIGNHMTLSERHKELQQEMKMIYKMKMNYEQIAEFIKHLAPYQSKNRIQLKQLMNKIFHNNLRSLCFEEFKTKCFIFLVEETAKKLRRNQLENEENKSLEVVVKQRSLSIVSLKPEDNEKYLGFSNIVNGYSVAFNELLLSSYESFLNNKTHAQVELSGQIEDPADPNTFRIDAFSALTSMTNMSYDTEMSYSPIFRSPQFKQLL